MTDARASNAGDRYHFVYVARRMLDMLPPDSELSLIEMENVSSADQKLADNPDALLGADLSEYHGGDSFATSSCIELTQVKYSPTHPERTWTLNRLSRNKKSATGNAKPGTSVLRKLANLFYVSYNELRQECRAKVRVKLVTNQPLHTPLESALEKIKRKLADCPEQTDIQSGSMLQDLASDGDELLTKLQVVTTLSWKRLSAFLRCWDLSTFNQPMASQQESEFFRLLEQYADAGVHFGNLINFVQEHAVPNRPTSIRKQDVYGLLRINESSFFPAPAYFGSIDDLIVTDDVRRVRSAIKTEPSPVVLVHGLSGTGKSSTLRFIQERCENEYAVIIYDCFGGGQGVGLDTGRFPFKTFFVQVTNELASRFDTSLYATTKLAEEEIIERFNKAIVSAAKTTKQSGRRLIVAVDAIDDAVKAAREQPNRQDKSFVPYLWGIRWPDNCSLVVSSRTENKPALEIRGPYSAIQLYGFSEKESLDFLQENWQEADEKLLRYAHERTDGNPRVLSKLIESVKREMPEDVWRFVDQEAQHTAFNYYDQKVPAVLGDNRQDWLLLAVLREASQFISVADLSRITGRSLQDVRRVLERLYFGLRIGTSGEIQWPDKDFVDYVRKFSGNEAREAKALLADYCLNNFDTSGYAQQHLSRHLYRAEQHRELVDWWMTDMRLVKRVATTRPHSEDAATDIQYTLLAAIELADFKTALQAVILAAEIAQGLDVFTSVIREYPRVLVEREYIGRLLARLRKHENEDLIATLFRVARALVEYGEQTDRAEQLFAEGLDVVKRIKRQYQQNSIRVQPDTVIDGAIYKAHALGLRAGLEWLGQWEPVDQVAIGYSDLTYSWCLQNDSTTAIEIIQDHALDHVERSYARLGVLRAGVMTTHSAQTLASQLLKSVRDGTVKSLAPTRDYPSRQFSNLSEVLDTLIRHGAIEAAVELMEFWPVSAPDSPSSLNAVYAQVAAYHQFLGTRSINIETFELERDKEENIALSEYQQKEHERENARARTRLKLLLPPRLLKLRALTGEDSEEEILDAINDYLTSWHTRTRPYWYRLFRTNVESTFRQLIETVTILSGYHLDVVRRIIEVSDHLVGSSDYSGLTKYAEVLSRDERYQAEAETLIYRRMGAIQAPDYSATEAVEALLDLYLVASEVDSNLALQIFVQARIEAGTWDSRIDGSAYALLATLQSAQPSKKLTTEQLNKLVTIFQVIKKVTEGYDVHIHLDWLVRLLTAIDTKYTFAALLEFDKTDFIDLRDSVAEVALSLLDIGMVADAIYPLTNLINSPEKGASIFEQAVIQLDDSARTRALDAYAEYIQTETRLESRSQYAQRMVTWAEQNRLAHYSSVNNVADLNTHLSDFKEKTDEEQGYHLKQVHESGRELITRYESALAESPQRALQILLSADIDDLDTLRNDELQDIVVTLVERLPSGNIGDILQIIERVNQMRIAPTAFSLLASVAERSSTSMLARTNYVDSLGRMLKPNSLDNLTRWRYREHLDNLLSCNALNNRGLLTAFLRATSNALPQLYANELYRLVGALSRLLDVGDAFSLYELLQERAIEKVPPSYSFAVEPQSADSVYSSYIQFLADCFGHPDQALCWLVLFTLVEVSINRPDETLPLLVDELTDSTSARWMAKRVWLLILFHHLSLRIPNQLSSYVGIFASIALNTDFPHVKMRYHAQQVILQLEAATPGLVHPETLARVKDVNQPKSLIEERISATGARGNNGKTENWSFSYDTSRYWFDRIERLFGGNRPSVPAIAEKWLIEKLRFSDEDAARHSDWVHSRYSYPDIDNSQGSRPRVESFKLYAELHASYLAAGELVDSWPAIIDEWSGEPAWEYYLRYFVRGLDPLLPSRYARPVPMRARNYEAFNEPYEEWVKQKTVSDFERELWVDGQKEWLVVSGSISGQTHDRTFAVIVDSYFVQLPTGSALARFLNSQDEFVPMPHAESPYESSLQEVMTDLANWSEESIFSHEIDGYPFRLLGWTVFWHQELPMEELNPKQAGSGLALELLTPTFCAEQSIYFNSQTLDWHHDEFGRIGYSEFWSHHEGSRNFEKSFSGRRLVIQIDFLTDFLRESDLQLLIRVRMRRSRPSNLRYKTDHKYDRGTVRAFLLDADGELNLDMDKRLIEKGRTLVSELSENGRTTLEKWMAHHLAGLMREAELAESQTERQTAMDRCAKLITRLWEIEVDKQATQLQQRLWNVQRISSDVYDDETFQELLSNPPNEGSIDPEEVPAIFRGIRDAEDDLLHLMAIADETTGDVMDSSIQVYLDREMPSALLAKLAQVFPDLEGLDLADKKEAQFKITDALRQLSNLRQIIFWEPDNEGNG